MNSDLVFEIIFDNEICFADLEVGEAKVLICTYKPLSEKSYITTPIEFIIGTVANSSMLSFRDAVEIAPRRKNACCSKPVLSEAVFAKMLTRGRISMPPRASGEIQKRGGGVQYNGPAECA